jgi:hypothetical protein
MDAMITDGTHACSLCGEWATGCSLCINAPLVSREREIMEQARQDREAEHELWLQSKSIADAATRRERQSDEAEAR